MIIRTFYNDQQISVPNGLTTLEEFRKWIYSDGYPEHALVSYIHGDVEVDMSPEKAESHNQVKSAVNNVLGPLVERLDSGRYYPDGLWLTSDLAGLSTEPDGTFATWETLTTRRAYIAPSNDEVRGGIEMRGTPDWVMEVVSDSSVRKDSVLLLDAYYAAGIREYWLIDARHGELAFTVYTRALGGFDSVSPVDGWSRSTVFEREFRFTKSKDRLGGVRFGLECRD